MSRIAQFVFVFALAGLVSCGGGNQTLPVGNTPNIPNEIGFQMDTPVQYATEFPGVLPQDAVQPWEELGSDGKVVSATGASSGFFAGTQSHTENGDTSAFNGALRMASGAVGDGNLSYAMYRIPLGGSEPGVVSVDANLRLMGDGNIGGYYVGLADYGNGSWQWFGPVADAHWRISAVQAMSGGSDFLTGLGNVFICVVAHDGAAIDVVGVGVDPVDVADTTAPDAPTNLALTPVAGGIELVWTAVGGNDVAGYKVYYDDKSFGEHTAQFVNSVEGLHGRSMILDATAQTFVAVSAVDKSGNESAISTVEGAMPLTGDAPEVILDVASYGVMRNEAVTLTASGANLYDWDTDGDGVFDILDDASGTASVDTSQTGLIRPLVRGTGTDSFSVAMSAVSVIVSSNARPVAVAKATPAFGDAPLAVTLTGTDSTDFDGTIVGGGWDYDGDGTYEDYNAADMTFVTSANHPYTTAGTYNAKLKVVDNEGAWDVDTVAITVAEDTTNAAPVAALSATPTNGDAPLAVALDASSSTDSDGTIVLYAWDWDGDGGYDTFSDIPTMSHTFTSAGSPEVKVRVEDNDGARHTATQTIAVNVVGNTSPTADLAATPSSGDTPLDVTLDASGSTDSDGSIENYEWDFDGDGFYDSYGSGNSISHTYTTSGVFTAKVRVTDDAGAQDTDTVDVTVNASPVAILTATPPTGDDPLDVAFSAADSTDSDGTIVDYEWDFDGDGTYNETGAEADSQGKAAPSLQTYNVGVWVASVRVTDDDGATHTASVTLTVHGWGTPQALDTTGDVGWFTSLAAVDGNPAISYRDATNGDLKYVRATDTDGSTWGTPIAVDTAGDVGWYTSLAMVDGNPAISYNDWTNGDLKYVRATDTDGSSWGTPQAIDTADVVGWYTSLAVVDGYPAISYYDDTNDDLKYVRATNASGSTWGAPQTLDTAGDVGWYTSLCVVDGNPAISYCYATSGYLKYIRATNANGSTWEAPQTLDSAGVVGTYTSLCVVDANPAISYFDIANWDLKYIRATNASGSSWEAPLAVDSAGNVGEHTSLCVVNGYPAISYFDDTNDDLKYVRATNASGSTWGAPQTLDSAGSVGWFTSLIEIDGYPAISYFKSTNSDLKYARWY